MFMASPRGPGLVWSLSNLASSYIDKTTAADTYQVNFAFQTDGSVDVFRLVLTDLNDEEQYVTPGSGSSSTYVRCTYVSGDHMTSGDAEDTWHLCSSQINFVMTKVANGGIDELSGVFTFELSPDNGTTVVATKSNVTVTAGSF